MWRLMMTNATKDWIEAGHYDTITAAARRIREIEGYQVTGVFLEMSVGTVHGTDEEALGYFEHTGRNALYVIKRRVN